MPYTINFSDTTKPSSITVPDMPPGINTVDTSLNLVGRGYPNYGQKIAENFVHLLENFAAAVPPVNPIEGQLWYDTSDPNRKVLRIMDGTVSSTRWASANGIYQQGTDPRQTSSLSVGDIWVDTGKNQLKIFSSNDWTLIGPMSTGGNKTGVENENIEDNSIPAQTRAIVKFWSDGVVIAILADRTFIPKVGIEGFPILTAGLNLRNSPVGQNLSSPTFNGVATAASKLQINGVQYFADNFLRKDDSAAYYNGGQSITGRVFFKTPNDTINTPSLGERRDGIVINNASSLNDISYIQFYKGGQDAILLNNNSSGKILLKIKKGSSLSSIVEIAGTEVNVNTSTSVNGLLTVNGNQDVVGELTVESTATFNRDLMVDGQVYLSEDITVNGQVYLNYLDNLGNPKEDAALLPSVPNTYDLGSSDNYFRSIFVKYIGYVNSTGTSTVLYGNVKGSASSLEVSTIFKLQGQVTATSFSYNGTSTEATFNATLTPTAVSSQTTVSSVSSDLNFLVHNTSTNSLGKVNYSVVADGVFPPGTMMSYVSSSTIPTGWLLCDGGSYLTSNYIDLFAVIGTDYGSVGTGYFNVPDYVTTTTTGGYPIYHIIKT